MSKRLLQAAGAVAVLAVAAPAAVHAQSAVGVGPTGPALSTPPGAFRPGATQTGPALSTQVTVQPGLGPVGPALSTPQGSANPRFPPRGPALSTQSGFSGFDAGRASRLSRPHASPHVNHAPGPRRR